MLDQVEFRPNGTCRYGHPPDFMAECTWKRRGDIVTIERGGKTLASLRLKDKDLALVPEDPFHTPFVLEPPSKKPN